MGFWYRCVNAGLVTVCRDGLVRRSSAPSGTGPQRPPQPWVVEGSAMDRIVGKYWRGKINLVGRHWMDYSGLSQLYDTLWFASCNEITGILRIGDTKALISIVSWRQLHLLKEKNPSC